MQSFLGTIAALTVVVPATAAGYGRVELPHALARKYPNANREWRWQFAFPQEHRWVNAKTAEQRRHHVHDGVTGEQPVTTMRLEARNCKHIANAETLPGIYRVLRDSGYEPPLIVTPEEFSGNG